MVMAMLIVALVFMGCPNVPSGTIIINGVDISTGLPYEEPSNGGENIESGEEVTEDDNGSGEDNDGTEVTVEDNGGEENNENDSHENGENSEENNGNGTNVTVEETPTEQLYRFGNEYITLTQFRQFLAENTWITEDDYYIYDELYEIDPSPEGNLYLCNDTDWVSLAKLESMRNVYPILVRNTDYTCNYGNHTITLTENGLKKVDTKLNIVPRTYTLTVYNKANVKTVYSGNSIMSKYTYVGYGNVSVVKDDNNVDNIFVFYNYYDNVNHLSYDNEYHENCQQSMYYDVKYDESETFTYGPTTEDPSTLKWKIYGGHMGNFYYVKRNCLKAEYDLNYCKMFGDNGWYTMDFVADDYGENVDTNLYVYATADDTVGYNIHLTTNLDEVETDVIEVSETQTF